MGHGDGRSPVAHRLQRGTQVIVLRRWLVYHWFRARPRSRLAHRVHAIPYTNLAEVTRSTGIAGRAHCASTTHG